ncbi:MAG: hypothetical protein Q9201_007558 [Fulgogasparrea decipioides]
MSFGLSISDLVVLPKLAWDVYSALKDAPGNHTALSDEVLSLHGILVGIGDIAQKLRKPLRPSERIELGEIIKGCQSALNDAETLLKKYPVEKGRTRAWARAKFAAADLTAIRLRIAAQIDRLDAYNNMLMVSSQARNERKVEKVIGALRRQGSVISIDSTSSCSSAEQSWSDFGRALEKQGITLQMALDGHDALKELLCGLTQHKKGELKETGFRDPGTIEELVIQTPVDSWLRLQDDRDTRTEAEEARQPCDLTASEPAATEQASQPIQRISQGGDDPSFAVIGPARSDQAVDQAIDRRQHSNPFYDIKSPVKSYQAPKANLTPSQPANSRVTNLPVDYVLDTAIESVPGRRERTRWIQLMARRDPGLTECSLTEACRPYRQYPKTFEALNIRLQTMLALLHSLDEYAVDRRTLTLWQHTAIRVLCRKRTTILLDLQKHFPVFQLENIAGLYDSIEGSSAKMAEIVIQVQSYNDLVSTFI